MADFNQSPQVFTQVFALPGASNFDIIEFCQVGSHNAVPDPDRFLDDDPSFSIGAVADAPANPFAKLVAENREEFREKFRRMPHGDEPWKQVQHALVKVEKISPFAIQFASQAALDATFLKPVKQSIAKEIATLVCEVNPEALELPAQDLEEMGLDVPMEPGSGDIPDDFAAMMIYIAKAGKFRMWWD